MENNLKDHWDAAFAKSETEMLGWYEATPKKTMELIEKCGLNPDSRILNVGVGTTTLIESLLENGFNNIIASDISSEALDQLKNRIGETDKVEFIQDDLTNPSKLDKIEPIDLWIDRAVLHFFNDEKDQETYWNLLNKILKPGGHAIIAVFSLDGAEKCCGLPVHRYSKESLQDGIGSNFELENSFDFTYLNPHGGERPYVYTLFKKK